MDAERRAKNAANDAQFQKNRAANALEKKKKAEADLREKKRRSAEAHTEHEKYTTERDAEDATRRIKEAQRTIELAQQSEYQARTREQELLERARMAPGEVVQVVGEKLKIGEIGYRGVGAVAAQITRAKPHRQRPDENAVLQKVLPRIKAIFGQRDRRADDLNRLVGVREQLSPEARQEIVAALRLVEDRVRRYVDLFRVPNPNDARLVGTHSDGLRLASPPKRLTRPSADADLNTVAAQRERPA